MQMSSFNQRGNTVGMNEAVVMCCMQEDPLHSVVWDLHCNRKFKQHDKIEFVSFAQNIFEILKGQASGSIKSHWKKILCI